MNHNHLSIFIANELSKNVGFEQFIGMSEGIRVSFCSITNNPIFSSADIVTGIGIYGIPLVDECELLINTNVPDRVIDALNSSDDEELVDRLLIKEVSTQICRQIQSMNWQPGQIKVFNEKIAASSRKIALIEKELNTEVAPNVHH
jgi:hypothetical protein